MNDKGSNNQLAAEKEQYIFTVGNDKSDSTITDNISAIPSLFVCGLSGTGKTTFIQNIIVDILKKNSAASIKLLIYSNKGEYGQFNGLNEMSVPVIDDIRKAVSATEWLLFEAKRRQKVLAENGTRSISAFNKVCVNEAEVLPELIAIFDDPFSYGTDPELIDKIALVIQNCRSVGIHVVIITTDIQSKYAKNILNIIPHRACFCVSSQTESKKLIGRNGAETLAIPGGLIYKTLSTVCECVVPVVDYDALDAAIEKRKRSQNITMDALGQKAANLFEKNVAELPPPPQTDLYYDELLVQATEVVLEMKSCSVSMLQRKLKQGYSRCARIVDQLEELGIVGPYNGAKPREVVVDHDGARKVFDMLGFDTSTIRSCSKDTISSGSNRKDDIPVSLRPFSIFSVKGGTISVSLDKVFLSYRVNTSLGTGTVSTHFDSTVISGLVLKKPGLFRDGFIQFIVKTDADIVNSSPELININNRNVSNYLTLSIEQKDLRISRLFLQQLAEDVGISVAEK